MGEKLTYRAGACAWIRVVFQASLFMVVNSGSTSNKAVWSQVNLFPQLLCTYQCKPRWGGGSAGKGCGFDGEVHPLSGRFDRVPLLGVRDI